MADGHKKKGFFGMIGQGLSTVGHGITGAGTHVVSGIRHMGTGESMEVVNPEGGEQDAEKEAEEGRFKKEDRDGYFKMMHKYIGADVTSMVTLPVIIFEPMTMIQKMAELMEYTELLNLADESEDPSMSLAYAVAWAVSVYYAYQRTWKPFNPILGETYELANHNGISFIAEQVSHHPPMSAGHAENEHFTYDCTSKLKTKFLGNALEVYPVGRTRVKLKRTGYELDLVPPPTKVHNLIFGRTWVDSPGDMVLTNVTTGDKVVLYFQPCGFFGHGRYEVDGYVYNAAEEPKLLLTGKWNSSLSCQPCDAEGDPLPGTSLKELWRVADAPKGDRFQYTHFANKMNSFETAPPGLLLSDSRLRPDRLALEHGDLHKAGVEKSKLEALQRAEKKVREERSAPFVPKWFKNGGQTVQTPWDTLEVFEFQADEYHAQRKEAEKHAVADQSKLEFQPWQFDLGQEHVGEVEAQKGIVHSSSS
eukprot:TRINITY_DN1576_c0_g1_i1.p1 TRINITY_DN1576_c0_g1~~TRINITY_DN1576_c0_g1_i1.p1  ORF type:complete len:476 (-),score=111.76 TRINITY_DN1576_c0_g1_i1:1035-2462(-)